VAVQTQSDGPAAAGEPTAALVQRVQELMARSEQLADASARELVAELTEAIMDLYGEGLARIGAALAQAGAPGAELREQLLEDGVVASLLLMHDLYPVPLEDRVVQALDSVRPHMQSHGGGVELLGVEQGVAHLRLQGHCDGCAASQATLEQAIRAALQEYAPDLLGLEVQGVVDGATAAAHAPPGPCASPAAIELPMAAAPAPSAASESTFSLPLAHAGPTPAAPSTSDSSLTFALTPPAELLSLAARELPPEPAESHCELCDMEIPDEHRHLLKLDDRRILCVCHTCLALRSGEAVYRPTGTRVLWLEELSLDEQTWSDFGIPVGLAFFLRSSAAAGEIVALYPSPAGATECELPLDAWERLAHANPALEGLEPDAEALIVNRVADPPQHAIAPIDECYRLVGTIKARWEGISGGSAIETAVPEFFADLRARAALAGGVVRA
jgi:Fe-S cluster biogenesis protein NfuA